MYCALREACPGSSSIRTISFIPITSPSEVGFYKSSHTLFPGIIIHTLVNEHLVLCVVDALLLSTEEYKGVPEQTTCAHDAICMA
jgi:hypothetical protein